ncbi:MAG: PDZ domain-containing protein [Proteobacteria bacterium]|nr:PDZ domain-containing protein [Pseudomonadota bacterium]
MRQYLDRAFVQICRAVLAVGLALLPAAPAPCSPAPTTPSIGWADVAARVIPGTVNILIVKVVGSYRKDKNDEKDPADTVGQRKRYVGSGFIVDPSGIIVTNRHLIAGALWITVRLEDGTELPAELVAASPVVDLALLKVDAGRPLPALRLAARGAVRVGDPVLAIGDPLALGTSLSAGIVSGLQRDLMNTPFDDYVQTDAAINHGNSGGPLIDAAGEVVGVNTILLTNQPNEGSNGLGFAISSTVVAAALRHLLHPAQRPIGWIGVQLQGMTPNLTHALALPLAGGFIVTGVDPDSPAQQAGIGAGDVILRYGGRTAPNARALMRDIATTKIGRIMPLALWQKDHIRQVDVTVRTWPQVSEAPADVVANPTDALGHAPPDLGLLLAPISPIARRAFKLGERKGVLVVAVDQMSEAYSRGLRTGAVIERIQEHAVKSPAEATRLIRADRLPLVALLVRWDDGAHWVVLHTGLAEPTPARTARGPRAATGQDAVGPATPAR